MKAVVFMLKKKSTTMAKVNTRMPTTFQMWMRLDTFGSKHDHEKKMEILRIKSRKIVTVLNVSNNPDIWPKGR